jgi:hypothetical protein
VSSSRQLPPKSDGPLPDLTSGAMWLATALAGLAALVLPGAAIAVRFLKRRLLHGAVAPHDATDPVELFRLADARLLERKRRGRQGLTAAA